MPHNRRNTKRGLEKLKMDVIKVSETKLVVHLTGEDMTKYRISTEEMKAFGAAAKGTLRRVLKKACVDSGFNCRDGVSVQVFSSEEGGCEMFVTSISANIAFSERDQYIHTVSKYVYRFSSVNDLIGACKTLKNTGTDEGAEIYADVEKKGRYYLEICDEAPELCEFGAVKLRLGDGVLCYLAEHCRSLRPGAASALADLA